MKVLQESVFGPKELNIEEDFPIRKDIEITDLKAELKYYDEQNSPHS